MNTEVMTKERWLKECAARFKQRIPDMTEDEASMHADLCLDSCEGDLSENPADQADEELSCWGE